MQEIDGRTYEVAHDGPRLQSLLVSVLALMRDGEWRTCSEIKATLKRGSESGIGARLRDLRKERFGSLPVEIRRRGLPEEGVWEYRIRTTCLFDPQGRGYLFSEFSERPN
jgi:hypothetical protein